MLVLRYFAFMGAALLALLLVCAAMLPKAPTTDNAVASVDDKPTIRIHSQRKWPERIVLDTNAALPSPPVKVEGPIVAPIPPASADAVASEATEEHSPAAAEKTRSREAFAELEQSHKRVTQLKKPESRRRRVVRSRMVPRYAYAPSYAYSYYARSRQPAMQVAQQPHYGYYW